MSSRARHPVRRAAPVDLVRVALRGEGLLTGMLPLKMRVAEALDGLTRAERVVLVARVAMIARAFGEKLEPELREQLLREFEALHEPVA